MYWHGNLIHLFSLFFTQNLVLLSPLLDCCLLLLRLQTCRLLQTLKHTKPKRRRRKTSTNINTSTNMTGLTKIHWGGSERGPSTAPRTRPVLLRPLLVRRNLKSKLSCCCILIANKINHTKVKMYFLIGLSYIKIVKL